MRRFFAVNAHLREENDYGGNFTVQTGWQWRGRTGHLLRLGMQYFNGMSEQYEFYNKFEEQIGVGHVVRFLAHSLLQRVQHHVQPDSGGVLAGVAAAAQRILLLQRAAYVVGRKDHAPVVGELDAFQLGRDPLWMAASNGPPLAGEVTGSRRETVLRSNPPYVVLKSGSLTAIRSILWLGNMAAISRRNDSVKAWLAQIESAINVPRARCTPSDAAAPCQ